ncbi:hypothetical protein BU17DRAFT_79063 [Hysterangium stoloniferum]|nr:hypothetical protein BU17DRAFT_79063 [Hysterangium stoloniferum]
MHTSSLPHILSPILSHPGLYGHPTAPVLRGLTPASPVQKPPPSPSSMFPRSQPFPPGRCQKALLLPGRWLLWLISHVEVPGSNNPLVHSKVAPASDSGPEPSLE